MNSQAMAMLYDEHEVILQEMQALRQFLETGNLAEGRDELARFFDFFRTYADKYHHQKEEDLLFSLLKDRHAGLTNIVEALETHHELFRDYLKDAEAALHQQNWESARSTLQRYLSDLTDHISAENDELFIAVDEGLSEAEKERLYFSFLDKDAELGVDLKKQYENVFL